MILTAGGKTDRGLVRANNEDYLYYSENLGLLVVADGMGGHASGETASRLAAQALRDYFRQNRSLIGDRDASYSATTNRLSAAVQHANRVVYEAARSLPELSGMGTTIAAAVIAENQLSIAHIGDSRVYLVRSGSIEQLTDDHSLVQEQVRQEKITKEEAARSEIKNILTRALGIDAEAKPDLCELTALNGDIVLLCSDGLYNMVSDEKMLEVISSASNAQAACDLLIDAANENGGKDNVSVVVGYLHNKNRYTSWWKFFR